MGDDGQGEREQVYLFLAFLAFLALAFCTVLVVRSVDWPEKRWAALGALGAALQGIAVTVALIYAVLQLRQNATLHKEQLTARERERSRARWESIVHDLMTITDKELRPRHTDAMSALKRLQWAVEAVEMCREDNETEQVLRTVQERVQARDREYRALIYPLRATVDQIEIYLDRLGERKAWTALASSMVVPPLTCRAGFRLQGGEPVSASEFEAEIVSGDERYQALIASIEQIVLRLKFAE